EMVSPGSASMWQSSIQKQAGRPDLPRPAPFLRSESGLLLVQDPIEEVTALDVQGLAAMSGRDDLPPVVQGVGEDEELVADLGERGVARLGQPDDVRGEGTGLQRAEGLPKIQRSTSHMSAFSAVRLSGVTFLPSSRGASLKRSRVNILADSQTLGKFP